MDGKLHVRNCCGELGIDCDSVIKLGQQNPGHKTSLIYKCPAESRKDGQRFAVCYFPAHDLYVAWRLETAMSKGKGSFRVLKDEVNALRPGVVLPVVKGVEFVGRGAETVYAFRPDAVKQFLETYLVPLTNG